MWSWQAITLVSSLVGAPWATITYIVHRIVRGDLVPRSVLMDRMRDKDAAIAALEATVSEKERQTAILLGRPAK